MPIQSFSHIVPMIYAYTTPGVTYHEGWIKIGYTEKQSVADRVKEQMHTAGIRWDLKWQDNAMYKDGSGEYFTDAKFHTYLTVQKEVEREPDTEWFKISPEDSRSYFDDFAMRKIPISDSGSEYRLRAEQERAVEVTKEYFENGGADFLWNAKPRFGKVLTSYDLIEKMGFEKVLIVTNRPAVSNAWLDDFSKFISHRGKYSFVSDNDSVKGKKFVISRDDYVASICSGSECGMIAFESLQGLKGSKYFGGNYDKLSWISKDIVDKFGNKQTFEFDLLIVDEAQEGVDTMRTDEAFRHIARKHTLYLSGTPFKALADEKFEEDQIFNWTYADEQEAKQNWSGEEFNPYEGLPQLNMYTYQLSDMIFEKLERGVDLSDDENVEYAFDLNEFFSTDESGNFIHEEDVRKFLRTLVTNEKYPFSTEELRSEMAHTIWLLGYVKSAKALAKLLKEDPVFSEYEIVLAAGDGKVDDDKVADGSDSLKSYDKVKKAIKEHDKTITLSVGQLTVGVTIPEWSGILMLCNMESPSSYIQAAFRVQNPCYFTSADNQRMRKERAYVFDFDPARTLVIYDEFANNLSRKTVNGNGSSDDRKENIQKLLNFFPIISEDDEGKMVELDAERVLSIPRKIKSKEVVKRGFMSNFLFKNISNIFGAPKAVEAIIQKLEPEREAQKKSKEKTEIGISQITLDDAGNVKVDEGAVAKKVKDVLGEKIYGAQKDIPEMIDSSKINLVDDGSNMDKAIKSQRDAIISKIKDDVIEPAVNMYKPRKAVKDRIIKDAEREVGRKFDICAEDFKTDINVAKMQHEKRVNDAETKKDRDEADAVYMATMRDAAKAFKDGLKDIVKDEIENLPKDIANRIERNEKEDEKKSVEESVREHLRGFTRTIPSFIMAYGEGMDGNLTIDNFDKKTEEDVFQEVTGITVEDFRFLRDGGDYTDDETGETKHFAGHLFDEIVFNDSVKEFWRLKKSLANYFRNDQDEDIFDYIPPQKTNQIFTPRWVVEKMVDELEEENPGCFDDDTKTFADLYMKSGLYITEIVKRLYKSEKMIEKHPDDGERIRHILTKQVYGMAPTRIIYLISTNFILGFDEKLKIETKNFVQADAAEAAKNGTLDKLIQECFPDADSI